MLNFRIYFSFSFHNCLWYDNFFITKSSNLFYFIVKISLILSFNSGVCAEGELQFLHVRVSFISTFCNNIIIHYDVWKICCRVIYFGWYTRYLFQDFVYVNISSISGDFKTKGPKTYVLIWLKNKKLVPFFGNIKVGSLIFLISIKTQKE